MGNPQFIHTPQGEELVVLARSDYEALLSVVELVDEDAVDLAIYDERMADLAEGRDEKLPEAVSQALLRGDTRLKATRKWRGLTQCEVAARAKVGQGYLSELENGQKRGASETISALAVALDVHLDWLS